MHWCKMDKQNHHYARFINQIVENGLHIVLLPSESGRCWSLLKVFHLLNSESLMKSSAYFLTHSEYYNGDFQEHN